MDDQQVSGQLETYLKAMKFEEAISLIDSLHLSSMTRTMAFVLAKACNGASTQVPYGEGRVITSMFPNQHVIPNQALQAIFHYEAMKQRLTKQQFEYYLMASVDCMMVSTTDNRPIICFEFDSHCHDTPGQKIKDSEKDEIFKAGGVPFARLRLETYRGKKSSGRSADQRAMGKRLD